MRLLAVKGGSYGFNIEAEVIPATKPGSPPFVYLTKLEACNTESGMLFTVSCRCGLYYLSVEKSLKGYESYVLSLESLLFGESGFIPLMAPAGFKTHITDSMSKHLYMFLSNILSVVADHGHVNAGIGEDCFSYPTELSLEFEGCSFS